MIRGITERTVTSPFLAEMPAETLETTDRTGVASYGGGGGYSMPSRTPSKYPRLQKGVLVRHAKFGLGRIAEIDETPVQAKAVVDFNAAGRKTLILEYAKLEPVG